MTNVGRAIVPCVLMLGLLIGCGPTPVITRTPVTFEFAVSGATEPLMHELTMVYHAAHSHITFNMRRLNSAQAIEALWLGEVDLAAVSWFTDTEYVWVTPVAVDGVAVIVHPSNPVRNLTLLQLRDIFRGRTAEWSDLGGPAGEITVVSRENGSGTRARFEQAVMEGRSVTVNAVAMPSEQTVLNYVAAITTAIGYIASGYMTDTVKAVDVESVPLTLANIAAQRYPMTRPLLFVTPEEPQGELRAFVAWVLGPEGQALVGKKYGRVK